jgi:nucleotide-binding universal stress UspA family protein
MNEQQAIDYLRAQVEHIQQQGVSATGSTYRGSPATVSVEVAKQKQANILVLATYGRTGLDAFLEENVAAKISNHSHIPLLLIRIREATD